MGEPTTSTIGVWPTRSGVASTSLSPPSSRMSARKYRLPPTVAIWAGVRAGVAVSRVPGRLVLDAALEGQHLGERVAVG